MLAATHDSTEQSRAAFATLCEIYWSADTFLRRQGQSAEDAQDLTQGLFARLLEKNGIRTADPARGRFRSFLLVSLKHFLANERERAHAQKRGGHQPALSLEFESAEDRYRLEPRDLATPELLFERRWALTVLDVALGRVQEEFARAGKRALFDALKIYLTGDNARASYHETGAGLGMSEGAVRVAVHRLRRRFGELLRDEIGQTVVSGDDVEAELQHLAKVLAR